jgi:uncharacterized Zn-finger protein
MLVNYKEEGTAADERSFYHANYLQHQNSVILFRNSNISKSQIWRVRTEEKPFKCPVCTESFNQNFNLVVHIRAHTGYKPFACLFYKIAFSSSSLFALKSSHREKYI